MLTCTHAPTHLGGPDRAPQTNSNHTMTTVIVHAGYVNASHVCFSDSPNQLLFNYIAAQGPLNGTVDEFWRMCLEQVGGEEVWGEV